MGPEELVRGAGEVIAAHRLNVDETVRRVVHRIYEDLSTDGMGLFGDSGYVVDGAG